MTNFASAMARFANREYVFPATWSRRLEKGLLNSRPLVDLAAALGAFAATTGPNTALRHWWASAAAAALLLICLASSGAYGRCFMRCRLHAELIPAFKGSIAFALGMVAVIVPAAQGPLPLAGAAFFLLAVPVTVLSGRLLHAAAYAAACRAGLIRRRLVLWGRADVTGNVAEELESLRFKCFEIVAILHASDRAKIASEAARAAAEAARLEATEVVICEPDVEIAELPALASTFIRRGLTVRLASSLLVRAVAAMPLQAESLRGRPVFSFHPVPRDAWHAVKRCIDIVIATAALVALLPLWALLSTTLALTQGRPVFFRQKRVRRNGDVFEFYKFRTMKRSAAWPDPALLKSLNVRAGPMFKVHRDPRVTPLGRWLRRLCIDETPQILNVLKGDISLVGARPPLAREVANYESWHRERLAGWMGITGLWQVSRRDELEFGDVVLLDFYYNHNFSLPLDAKIAFETILAITTGRCAL